MKILIVHNYYASSSPSGEDVVFEAEIDLLKRNGHDVTTFVRDMGNGGPAKLLSAVKNLFWSSSSYKGIQSVLRDGPFDIAHFHNIYPFISPSGYKACHDSGVPVVQTLHNYRMVCANGMLLDQSGQCETCLESHHFYNAIKKGCYRNSRLASTPIALMQTIYEGKWPQYVDTFIALTESGRLKHIESGLPPNQVVVKPNFVEGTTKPNYNGDGNVVFLGRLKHEKGIHVLVDAWKSLPDIPLSVFGDGPDKEMVVRAIDKHGLEKIQLHGQKPLSECLQALGNSEFLVMSSIWYEGFPRIICEAYFCGKAVVAPDIGAMSEVVIHGETGLLYKVGDSKDLAEKVNWLYTNRDKAREMGINARKLFENKYSPERNHEALISIYEDTIQKYKKLNEQVY